MEHENRGTIIPVANTLKLKVGGHLASVDMIALAKAEEALRRLANNADAQLQDELGKLEATRARIASDGYTAESGKSLYDHARDLAGLASAYSYSVVAEIANSLCRLTADPAKRLKLSLVIIDGHIGSIKAAMRGNIRHLDHANAPQMLAALKNLVAN